MDNMSPILKESIRVCKKNGKIIFDYRNRRNPLILCGYKTVKIHDPEFKMHLNAYSRGEIKALLNTLGIKRVKYYAVPMWWKLIPPAFIVELYKQ